MQLQSVHVTNFRSVEDSEVFQVGQVTCLVGKNEAGKSAILLALAALNPHATTPAVLDKERDYPRRYLNDYDTRHPEDDACAITSTWRLESAEIEKLQAAVGTGVVNSDLVTVSRRYGKNISIETTIDFPLALEFLYTKFELDESERAVLSGVKTTSALADQLGKLTSPTPKHTKLKQFLDTHGSVSHQVQTFILSILPKFMYFASYDRMAGAVQLDHVKQLVANKQIELDEHRGKRLFAEFMEYAGVSIDEIMGVSTYEAFNARLGGASNNITDQVLEYWTQNPDLSVEVRVDPARPGDPPPLNTGTIARARIYNHLHRVDTPFSERSAGFVWFFSFLVKFARVKNDATPVVLLLDEPGLTLHGKAQADLLRFFKEKLAPHHQIIYSTHSPFMVPADNLASVRIVEDRIEMKGAHRIPIGTKVREDILTRDPDTLFPLQGALGYEITQSLFVGKHTLLVEGPGDILYIQSLSDALARQGRSGLDARWTLCPAGGIDKIRPFVSLFSGNSLHIAALSDQGAGDKRKVEDLRRSELLAAGHFFTVADFLDRPEADIEDVFDPELFVAILNACYGLKGTHKLTVKTLREADSSTARLVKQAESAFRVLPDTIPVFDHFSPAAWLIRNPEVLEKETTYLKSTLDRAERIFSTFNKLL